MLGIIRSKNRGSKGFGLLDLTASLLVLPTVIMVVVLGSAREQARQAACMANLSTIGKGVALYSASTNDQYPFPLLRSQGDPMAPVNATTVAKEQLDMFKPAFGDCAMQNVWLLMGERPFIHSEVFHCPSDGTWTKRTAAAKFGWTAPTEFSYGMHFPYDKDAAGTESAAKLSNADLDPGIVMFPDRSPGGAVGPNLPPTNHGVHGEAYLKRDYSVSFYKSSEDSKCGYHGDDIYVNTYGKAGGVPTDAKDRKAGTDTSICPSPASQPASAAGSAPASKMADKKS